MASNGIAYEFIMEAEAVEALLGRLAETLPRQIVSLLLQTGTLVKEEMSSRAPEGVAAAMGQGIKNNIGLTIDPALMTADIRPTNQVPYGDAVETGSRPHRPPAGPDSALAQWCEMKGLSVWAVATSIARNGTRPHPYIEPTYEATKELVGERFGTGIAQYIEGLMTL